MRGSAWHRPRHRPLGCTRRTIFLNNKVISRYRGPLTFLRALPPAGSDLVRRARVRTNPTRGRRDAGSLETLRVSRCRVGGLTSPCGVLLGRGEGGGGFSAHEGSARTPARIERAAWTLMTKADTIAQRAANS